MGLWEKATERDRGLLVGHIDRRNKKGINQWVRLQTLKVKDFKDWPVSKLRPFARELGVQEYHHLRKAQLVWQIERKLDAEAEEEADYQERCASREATQLALQVEASGTELPTTPSRERNNDAHVVDDGGSCEGPSQQRNRDE